MRGSGNSSNFGRNIICIALEEAASDSLHLKPASDCIKTNKLPKPERKSRSETFNLAAARAQLGAMTL